MKKAFLSVFLSLFLCHSYAQIITTVAGSSTTTLGDGGQAVNAGLSGPIGVAFDDNGNFYIADTYNNRIRKVDAAGIITTIAGNDTTGYNGDEIPATNAHLLRPVGIVCDHSGNILFADGLHNRVRKIDSAGIISTVAGNGIGSYNGDNILAISAEIQPWSITMDVNGNIYISDWGNHRIRKVNSTGIITTIAGTGTAGSAGDNGPATAAEINEPYGIALDNNGNIYFADANENVIRKIDITGIITTFAGGNLGSAIGDNGPATDAKLAGPGDITIDGSGNVYIADVSNQRIRRVDALTGIINTVVGSVEGFSGDNGLAINAELNEPGSITINASGDLYISDFGNNRIRRVGWPEIINQIAEQPENVIIYPNPGTTQLTICATNNITNIAIANFTGQTIYSHNFNSKQAQIDVMYLPAGIYFITINGSETRKFVKE